MKEFKPVGRAGPVGKVVAPTVGRQLGVVGRPGMPTTPAAPLGEVRAGPQHLAAGFVPDGAVIWPNGLRNLEWEMDRQIAAIEAGLNKAIQPHDIVDPELESNHYLTLVFQDHHQLYAFLEGIGWDPDWAASYLTCELLADCLGLTHVPRILRMPKMVRSKVKGPVGRGVAERLAQAEADKAQAKADREAAARQDTIDRGLNASMATITTNLQDEITHNYWAAVVCQNNVQLASLVSWLDPNLEDSNGVAVDWFTSVQKGPLFMDGQAIAKRFGVKLPPGPDWEKAAGKVKGVWADLAR